jgi:hypothetical protein
MLPLLVFLISSTIVYFSYEHTQNYLKYNTLKFSSLSVNKQYYVVKNITKGIYLSFLVIVGWFMVIQDAMNDIFVNQTIRIFASLYVSNDVVGLFRVSKLPTSTRLHHSATVIFLLVAWNVDFEQSNVGRLLLLYTYFSAISFPVNLYLGLRLCYDGTDWLKTLSKYIYAFGCMCNWYIQFQYFIPSTESYMYMTLLLVIITDDIVLLKWLWK